MTYQKLGEAVGALVDEKNAAYGSAFDRAGVVLNELYPNGIQPNQYTDMLAVVRIIDKLFRIATDRDAFGEDPFRDIAGYGLLGCMNRHSSGSAVMESVPVPPCMSEELVESCGGVRPSDSIRTDEEFDEYFADSKDFEDTGEPF